MIPAIVTALLSVAPSLITMVEGLFKDKPKSGQEKLATVLGMLRTALERMKDAGALPKDAPAPSDQELITLIETLFQQGKAGTATAGAVRYFMVRGEVVPVTLP